MLVCVFILQKLHMKLESNEGMLMCCVWHGSMNGLCMAVNEHLRLERRRKGVRDTYAVCSIRARVSKYTQTDNACVYGIRLLTTAYEAEALDKPLDRHAW